ncbi:Mycolic acid cyclopropane synthetase-domain-containing protein [Amylocarpus encephaloides]|uniref:Mycolic acid cyclopropane synthetase-domain-containing protein n=1 Tax=Amylocarpus encephaloides TaxID=45428 RepID=A0A9P8C961_9HELO|nr:Mycolic acid cyclopropane synthetase-domain-containing protein [Amylocarpus encephaloides]
MASYITHPLAYGSDLLRNALGNVTWGPALSISKATMASLFSRIETGTLIVDDQTPGGKKSAYGQRMEKGSSIHTNGVNGHSKKGGKIGAVEVVIHKEAFWVRLFLFADMGFAESYMLGEFECSDLTKFFELFILNRNQLANATTLTSSIAGTITGLARSTNTLSNSLLNVSAHYDISNEMFAAFLSDDMTYSCPIWRPHSSADEEEESLEAAQMTKLHRFIDGAHIKPTDHVLEIGTGWGSFAIEAVKKTGCRVTSLTLSIEQKGLAEKRISAAGFEDKIEVKLMDYRALPIPRVPYDKVVSIEMLEAIGREYLETYFACIHRLLKKDGIAVFQCITMPEGRYDGYAKGEDFIRKYIFPGGHLPSITQLVDNITKGSEGTLVIERIENIGGHYAKTLRLWKEKFMANFESRIRSALMLEHKNMGDREVEVFRKKWEYYFCYCEAGFATKTLGDAIITVGREGAMELMEGIQL